jgi:hypothetical protein
VDGLELTVAPQNRDRALDIYKDLKERTAQVGETRLPTRIVEVPEGFEYGLQVATELQIAPGAALVRTYDFEPYGSFSNVPVLSGRWWEVGHENRDVALGLAAYVEQAMLGSNTTIRWPGGDAMAEALTAVEQSRGRDAAMAVVGELYALRSKGLTREQAANAITRAAQGDVAVLDALKRLR